jgi:hydrogenase maturation protease
MTSGTLVAGIGNIFLGDDGFGVEVAGRLARAGVPDGVRVADYGIRGMHLAYDLASGYDAAILIDATPRGDPPGTLYIIDPDLSAPPNTQPTSTDADHSAAEPDGPAVDGSPDDGGLGQALAASPFFDAHGMQPDVVLAMLGTLDGGRPRRILIVGCEPASVDYGIGLSGPVAAMIDRAVRCVQDLLASDLDPEVLASDLDPELLDVTERQTYVSRHPR